MRVDRPFVRRGGWSAVAVLSVLLVTACGPEDDLQEPVPLFEEVPIEYPLPLWDEGVEGTTVLRVRVTETGVVDSTMVLESSGHEAFDSAAVHGGRRLRFEPAVRDGERVVVWAHVPVRFSLSGDDEADATGTSGGGGGEVPDSAEPSQVVDSSAAGPRGAEAAGTRP